MTHKLLERNMAWISAVIVSRYLDVAYVFSLGELSGSYLGRHYADYYFTRVQIPLSDIAHRSHR